ncbi:hypothetical protein HFN49_18095 [Rhizobium leguminosarum]|uniref:hypothetical protein n=1 Tax=Rhizobium ruizarguesonis TaxID=2081791 RepID=UPI001A990535|nr:hypothetical protein [Rhizobium ruizarguesonis]MBY5888095.1 hypothetical protein [Rhizobium leguminosarum]QSZ02916.1 hypothetical protein J3P73_10770 [Rhizobium ruizarguesonis]
MNDHYSLLSDDEIFAECAKIAAERAQGKIIGIEELADRLKISVETALALGAEEASRFHGRPMKVIRVESIN